MPMENTYDDIRRASIQANLLKLQDLKVKVPPMRGKDQTTGNQKTRDKKKEDTNKKDEAIIDVSSPLQIYKLAVSPRKKSDLKASQSVLKQGSNYDPRGIKRGRCLSTDCEDCETYGLDASGDNDGRCVFCWCPYKKHMKCGNDPPVLQSALLGDNSVRTLFASGGVLSKGVPTFKDICTTTDVPTTKDDPTTKYVPTTKDVPTSKDVSTTKELPVESNSGEVKQVDENFNQQDNSPDRYDASSDQENSEDSSHASSSFTCPKPTSSARVYESQIYKPVPDNVPLPPMCDTLLEAIESDNILKRQSLFVRTSATHLLSLTGGKPTSSDYKKYSNAIVSAFPQLADKNTPTPNASFSAMLSNCIRNRRAYARRGNNKNTVSAERVKDALEKVTVSAQSEHVDPKDLKLLIEELKKYKRDQDNVSYIKILMRRTVGARRKWLRDNECGCSDIIKEFPHLTNSDLAVHDFELLGYGMSRTNTGENLSQLLTLLSALYKVPVQSEFEKLQALLRAQKDLSKGNINAQDVLTVCKVFESTDAMVSSAGSSPRLVVFVSGEKIEEAFLVADKNVEVTIAEPLTVLRLVTCLLAFYYMCDIDYPRYYRSFLLLIDSEVMGVKLGKSVPLTLLNFKKKLNIA